MKSLLFIAIILIPVFVSASNIDPLYDFDYTRVGIRGLYLSGGPEARLDNALYDSNGKKVSDISYKSTDIWLPLKVGYAFNGRSQAGIVLPIASLDQTTTIAGADSHEVNTGLGNPWVWFKACYFDPMTEYFRLRFGVKLPFLAYTREDSFNDVFANRFDPNYKSKAITGDKSTSLDFSAIFTHRKLQNTFRLDGHLALRYNLEGTYKYNVTDSALSTIVVEEKLTPGMTLDFRAMPGIAFGANKSMETYLWLEYWTKLTDDVQKYMQDGVSQPQSKTSGGSMFTAGIRADYLVDPNNTVELKFLYDVLTYGGISNGNNLVPMPAGISVGIGYFGYIPF
jgi:hypothetical protein